MSIFFLAQLLIKKLIKIKYFSLIINKYMIQYMLLRGGIMGLCNLMINKRLELGTRSDSKSVIINRNTNKEILILDRTISWFEEVPNDNKNRDIIKLILFSSISKNKIYFIEEVLIDMNKDSYLYSLITLCKDMPIRLDGNIYRYNDLDNNLCLLNLKTNVLSRIENKIRDKFRDAGIEVDKVKLNNIENSNTDYELIIELKDMDIIHTIIRIDNNKDDGYKINNTIYSEYYGGLKFNVSKENNSNEFIDSNIFIDDLVKHITSISKFITRKKLLDDTFNVQTNIKVRMMCKK